METGIIVNLNIEKAKQYLDLPLKITGRSPQVWSRWSGTVTDSPGAIGGEDPIDKHPDVPVSAEGKHIHTL